MLGENFTVAGEVVLFDGRGCQGGFRVEEAGELSDQGFSLATSVNAERSHGLKEHANSIQEVLYLCFCSLLVF